MRKGVKVLYFLNQFYFLLRKSAFEMKKGVK
jgi:hypothetical protein